MMRLGRGRPDLPAPAPVQRCGCARQLKLLRMLGCCGCAQLWHPLVALALAVLAVLPMLLLPKRPVPKFLRLLK